MRIGHHSPLEEMFQEKTKEICASEVATAMTTERLKEICESIYYLSTEQWKIASKRWDRLSLKEVESAKTLEDLKIAQSRSRQYSQAWYIVKKKLLGQ